MDERANPRTSFWKSLSALDWVALMVCVFGWWAIWTGLTPESVPGIGLVKLLGIVALFYLLYRFWVRWRNQLLWSLKGRLIVAYVFIAGMPVFLMLFLASWLGQMIYSQLGAYILYHDVQDRLDMLADSSASLAAAESTLPASINPETLQKSLKTQIKVAEGKRLPGLDVNFDVDPAYFREIVGAESNAFTGLVQRGAQLHLVSLREVGSARGRRVIELNVPVTAEFLEGIAPDFGPIDVTLAQTVEDGTSEAAVRIGEKNYRRVGGVVTRSRTPPLKNWLDPIVNGFAQLKAVYLDGNRVVERDHLVIAFFQARRSQLNHRIFALPGELSRGNVLLLQLIAGVFLVIELFALLVGIRLTRAITGTVSDLSQATQLVQAGDLTARVPVKRRDQLGMLGESFNSMTSSIGRLISEQKQLQRLENEISIAREVQDQLFPRNLPQVEGVEIEAICRAARSVSGDYYDFIQLSPTQLAIAIADISGKGISAALLMASLQAALRSQLLSPESESMSTAELVSRLNRHLVRNTGDDRFATFFVAVYDLASRKLRYTNAGHLPGFCLADGKSRHLDVGGIVLGIVEEYPYQEGCVDVPNDAVFITYSDGLVEPENAYGEEFGISRLEAAAQRVRQASPRRIAESLMTAAEEWSGTPEQMDDMTVVVAKLK